MQTAELERIVRDLERLRLERQDFNQSIDSQERELLQDFARENSVHLEETQSDRHLAYPPHLPDLIRTPNQVQVHLRATSISSTEYRPIASNLDIQPGDRVRISNALRHISGPISEEDRLATVVKVNKVFIQVRTDSGHLANRIKKNLKVAAPQFNERVQGRHCEDGRRNDFLQQEEEG